MLTPADEPQLAEAVRDASGPLRIEGGGTRQIGRDVNGTTLSVARLSGIPLYEPGALTLVAAAGTPVSEVEAALAAQNQRLPFEPMDHRAIFGTEGTPTIGGVVAVNASGPRRVQAGACRDSLIGVRFVDGTGTVTKNGGRVMKNVTGYDLVKLLAGSHGTLGVLTEVSFKVLPAAPATGTLILSGLTTGQAVRAMADALRSPYEVSGAAHVPGDDEDAGRTLLRLEGFETQVSGRSAKLADILKAHGDVEIVDAPENAGAPAWSDIRDARMFAGTGEDLWRISVKPTDGARVAEALEGARLMLDWGGGLVWAGVAPGTDLRPRLGGIGGHATLIRASAETRMSLSVFEPEAGPLRAIAEGLRARFDPRGILNTGRMG